MKATLRRKEAVEIAHHICIITTAHPLDDVRVTSKIMRSFLDRGFRVSWVGPDVVYFSQGDEPDSRVAYHLTRPNKSRTDRLLSAWRVSRKAREVSNVDWYYSPDPDAAGVAVKLASRSNARVLFDIHEIFDGANLDRWLCGHRAILIRKLVRHRVARTSRKSDLVIGVSDSVLQPYFGDAGDRNRIRNCAPRWFGESIQQEPCEKRRDVPRKTTFMHGKALVANGSLMVLAALVRLRELSVEGRVVMFPAMGPHTHPYMADLTERIEALTLGRSILLHKAVRLDEMPALLAECDVGMIAYGRDLGADSLPNRLFEYMACGLAILAPDYAIEIRRIVEREDIGLTVDFEDPHQIAEAMKWFIDNPEATEAMGRRARDAFLARHNWDFEFDRLAKAMDLIGQPGGSD